MIDMDASIVPYRGRFSEDQIREFNDAFHLLDKDNNGSFLVSELREMFLTIGYNPTDNALENLTIVADDGNGKIVFDEFMDILNRLETDEKNTKEAKDCFNAFDFEGKGYIPANEIKEALLYVMDKAPDTDKEGVIQHFKLEKNRRIFFPEFKQMVSTLKPQS